MYFQRAAWERRKCKEPHSGRGGGVSLFFAKESSHLRLWNAINLWGKKRYLLPTWSVSSALVATPSHFYQNPRSIISDGHHPKPASYQYLPLLPYSPSRIFVQGYIDFTVSKYSIHCTWRIVPFLLSWHLNLQVTSSIFEFLSATR